LVAAEKIKLERQFEELKE